MAFPTSQLANRALAFGRSGLCVLGGAAELISIALIRNKWLLFVPILGIRVAWAIMPAVLMRRVHEVTIKHETLASYPVAQAA
jgi:hypothetical protein